MAWSGVEEGGAWSSSTTNASEDGDRTSPPASQMWRQSDVPAVPRRRPGGRRRIDEQSAEERRAYKARRSQDNRESAQRSRARKRELQALRDESVRLHQENESLRARLAAVTGTTSSDASPLSAEQLPMRGGEAPPTTLLWCLLLLSASGLYLPTSTVAPLALPTSQAHTVLTCRPAHLPRCPRTTLPRCRASPRTTRMSPCTLRTPCARRRRPYTTG
jgi:hypothetical protein